MTLFFKVKRYLLKEQINTIKEFYSNWCFVFLDVFMGIIYSFHNPYSISKNYLKKRGECDLHVYGETTLSSWQKMAKECALFQDDVVIEMGSGRGKGGFWLSSFIGCEYWGIERIPYFVGVANFFAKILSFSKVHFSCQDMFKANLKKASCVYLYGTLLNDAEIKQICQKFLKELPDASKIITISYPLSDYDRNFKTIKSFEISFPWGKTRAFLNTKL